MKMKELPQSERPYEKLEMYGAHTLSNAELLAIIIKSGTRNESSISTAQKILSMKNKNSDNLRFIQDMSIEEFRRQQKLASTARIAGLHWDTWTD